MTSNPKTFHISNDVDLGLAWEQLMGPHGYDQRSLWLLFLDGEGRTLPAIIPISDLPPVPGEDLLASLGSVLQGVTTSTEAVSVAMLLSRPGNDVVTDSDRRWARALLNTVPSPQRTGCIHLATAGRVRALAADDLFEAA